MKLVPVILLFLLGSLVGCSTQSDQSEPSSQANPQHREIADQAVTPEDAGDLTATENGELEQEPNAKLAESGQRNRPPLAVGDTPTKDEESARSEETLATTDPEDSIETEPVSWLQRIRFWDMANRIIAKRNQEPAEFDDAELKDFAFALKQVQAFHQHIDELLETLQDRARFANSDYFDQKMLASIRDEISLPSGTRDRFKKLASLDVFQDEPKDNLTEQLESKLIRDQINKGDLLQLSIRLREKLMRLLALREQEILLDEFFLSFPWRSATKVELDVVWGWYPDVMKTTARELWTTTPPVWFQEQCPILLKANLSPTDSQEYVNQFLAYQERPKAPPNVMGDSEFQELVDLANWFEELGGGPGRLLIFPEIGEIPSRDRVVEASKRNLAAVNKADDASLLSWREALHGKLSEKDKQRLARATKRDSEEGGLDVVFLMNLDFESSDYLALRAIDDAIETRQGLSLFYTWDMPGRLDFYSLVEEARGEVFDTGARWYFDHSE